MSFTYKSKTLNNNNALNSDLNNYIKRKGNLKRTSNKEKKRCLHDLNFFTKELKSTKKKDDDKYYKFCLNCGSMFIFLENTEDEFENMVLKTIPFIDKKTTKNYFDPFLLFKNARKNYINENLYYDNNYLLYRKEMINFVLKLKKKYRASMDTYFLTIRLIDIICSKVVKFVIDIELITIGSFFLAGIF